MTQRGRVPRLHLVRHAEPAARYTEHPDPGLSDLGRDQAAALIETLAPLGAVELRTSPLRRAVETGEPVAAARGATLVVDEAVAEIHSPADDLAERAAWLHQALRSTWSELGERQQAWRAALVERLLAVPVDTVVFTHFVAINVAIGAATGADRVVCATVGHTSVTTFDVVTDAAGTRLELVAIGEQTATEVR